MSNGLKINSPSDIENPVKPGWKTSEFWMTMFITILGFAVQAGWVPLGDKDYVGAAGGKVITGVWATIAIWKYIHSRGMVKAALLGLLVMFLPAFAGQASAQEHCSFLPWRSGIEQRLQRIDNAMQQVLSQQSQLISQQGQVLALLSAQRQGPVASPGPGAVPMPAPQIFFQLPGGQAMPIAQNPWQQLPLGQAPLQQLPLGQAPLQQLPLGQAPLQQLPLGQAPQQQLPIGQAPLQQLPLGGTTPQQQLPLGQGQQQQPKPQMVPPPMVSPLPASPMPQPGAAPQQKLPLGGGPYIPPLPIAYQTYTTARVYTDADWRPAKK